MNRTGKPTATACLVALLVLTFVASAVEPTPTPAPQTAASSTDGKEQMRQMLQMGLEGKQHGMEERGAKLIGGDLLSHALARAEHVRPDVPRPVQFEWAKGYMLTFDQKQAAFVLGLMIGGEDGDAAAKAGDPVPTHDGLDTRARLRADETWNFEPEAWAMFVTRYKAGYEVGYKRQQPAW